MMKTNLATALLLVCTVAQPAFAHDCPYDWNVSLAKELSFTNASVSNVIRVVNAVVREQTKGWIKEAAILDTTPLKIMMVPVDSPWTNEMAILINRYREEMVPIIAKGAQGYETCPITVTFPKKFPIACILKMIGQAKAEMGYEEKKEGAISVVGRRPSNAEPTRSVSPSSNAWMRSRKPDKSIPTSNPFRLCLPKRAG